MNANFIMAAKKAIIIDDGKRSLTSTIPVSFTSPYQNVKPVQGDLSKK